MPARSGITRDRPSIRRPAKRCSSRTATRCGLRWVSAWSGIRRSDRCGSTIPSRLPRKDTTRCSNSVSAAAPNSDPGRRTVGYSIGMTEPFFFKPQAGMTVGAIADMTGAKPRGPLQTDRVIGGLAPLGRAGPHELTFLDNAKYTDGLRTSRAGACLISERFAADAPESLPLLVTRDPYRAFVAVARALYPEALRPSSLF